MIRRFPNQQHYITLDFSGVFPNVFERFFSAFTQNFRWFRLAAYCTLNFYISFADELFAGHMSTKNVQRFTPSVYRINRSIKCVWIFLVARVSFGFWGNNGLLDNSRPELNKHASPAAEYNGVRTVVVPWNWFIWKFFAARWSDTKNTFRKHSTPYWHTHTHICGH